MSTLWRFGLAWRLGLVLALVSTSVALVTGYYAYTQSKDLLVESTHAEISDLSLSMVRRLAQLREDVGRDLTVLARYPAVLEELRRPGGGRERDLQDLFSGLQQANDLYLQVRLIAAQDYGKERIRVDRDVQGPVVVSGGDLREMEHLDYVFEALSLAPGQLYLSPITINHEDDAHLAQGRAGAVLSMPVHDSAGKVWGVLVVNADLQAVFAKLKQDLPQGFELLMTNGEGDYLVHPDAQKTFGFDRGRRMLLQDDVPQAKDLFVGSTSKLLTVLDQAEYAQAPVLAAFFAKGLEVHSGETRLVMGVTRPLQPIVAQVRALLYGTLRVVAGVVVVCAFLAFVLARLLVRPLSQMRRAVSAFGQTGAMDPLPTQRSDEIGLLARGVQTMGEKIAEQLNELRDNQEELQHLAQHDMLTGLPNRRFLQERLAHALALARRSGRSVALLFIDLDYFKDVNDNFGHEAGDALLVALAQRLRAHTREADTVARMGGDEFVVLLDGPADEAQIGAIAQKLLHSLQQPVPWRGHALQVGASIGISQFPRDGQTAQDMLACADRAMYRVKNANRNDFEFFSE
jgi:diguanylate cyclase (GGDEF)-like protein